MKDEDTNRLRVTQPVKNPTNSLKNTGGFSPNLLEEVLEVPEQQSQTLLIQGRVRQHGSDPDCGERGDII